MGIMGNTQGVKSAKNPMVIARMTKVQNPWLMAALRSIFPLASVNEAATN